MVKKLGPKTVKRSDIKFKKAPVFPCHSCEFIAKSVSTLKKHKHGEHMNSFNSSKKLVEPRHSTRNNSVIDNLMIEDVTVSNITDQTKETNENTLEENTLKYLCNNCRFVTTSKSNINEHV